ncbi:hypothetical protein DZC75_16800 [Pseudomonas parafulva]|uniref:Uncharacterized protein n=1 Tax=Pseudomonas parafulva TaxID=157782 RepID=A0AAI8PCJ6_9PSED|nr:hypothetical protein [Pseudomonas parafulva]AXO89580.1 hypothetical protein DZC75_16800 [Pseudomonas parafulva]
MADPRDKAAAQPPPTLGEGCLARYDPDALSDELGTAFEGAAQLWAQLNRPDDASAPAADAPASRRTPAPRPAGRSSR